MDDDQIIQICPLSEPMRSWALNDDGTLLAWPVAAIALTRDGDVFFMDMDGEGGISNCKCVNFLAVLPLGEKPSERRISEVQQKLRR